MHFDERFDLVIVGSGCASVTAALAAQALGARPVIIEKQALFGGSTAYSGGIGWLPNNPLLDDDNEADARAYLDAVVGPPDKASPVAKREAFLQRRPARCAVPARSGGQADPGAVARLLFRPSRRPQGRAYGVRRAVRLARTG